MLCQLESKYKEFERISSSQVIDFPAKLLKGILEVSCCSSIPHSDTFPFNVNNSWVFLTLQAHLSSCPDKEKGAQERLIEPLLSLVKSYEGGRESHAHIIVQSLFEEYLFVEELFSDNIRVSNLVWLFGLL